MLTRSIAACVFLLSAAVACAEPPKAIITGRYGGPPPTKLIPGEVNVLNSADSVGERFTWKVKIKLAGSSADEARAAQVRAARKLLEEDNWQLMPPPKGATDDLWSMIEGKRQLLMPSLPGVYHVILASSNAEDVDIAEYDLVIDGAPPCPIPVPVPPTPTPTPTPVPVPIPVPIPVPDTSLSGNVAAAVAKIVTAANQGELLMLAETYSRLGALAETGTIPSVEALVKTTEVVTAATVAQSKAAWDSIYATIIAPKLVSLTSTADYSAAWKAISAGIKAGAGAQPPPVVIVNPPAPVPANGLHALIVEETDDRGKLTREQRTIFTSTKLDGWLRTNAPGNWRIWDHNILDTAESKAGIPIEWIPVAEFGITKFRANGNKPWIVISNGATGYDGPLPQSEDDTLALLEKYKP